MDTATLAAEIQAVLTPDLLRPAWRKLGPQRPYAGHCYAASEAAFHLLGGRAAGWRAQVIRHEGGTHWYLKHDGGEILDITAEQFRTPVPYDRGRNIGFLTLAPSLRAREIIRRLSGRLS